MSYRPRFSLTGQPVHKKAAWARRVVSHNMIRPRELARPGDLIAGTRLHTALRSGGWTMTSSRHGRTLFELARDVRRRGVVGDLVDCGSRNGGSSVLLGAGAETYRVWALDSFEGLPQLSAEDGRDARWAGELKGSEEMLADGFTRFAPNVDYRIVKGWFKNTLPEVVNESAPVAILHIDADLYDSVRDVLDALADKVTPGGYVVVDDYQSWEGCRQATDEYLSTRANIEFVDKHFWQVPA